MYDDVYEFLSENNITLDNFNHLLWGMKGSGELRDALQAMVIKNLELDIETFLQLDGLKLLVSGQALKNTLVGQDDTAVKKLHSISTVSFIYHGKSISIRFFRCCYHGT